MVAKDVISSQCLPLWIPHLKYLLIEVNLHQDNVSVQQEIIEKIFNIIAENISEVKEIPLFADAVCKKLNDWKHSMESVERNIFDQFSFILVDLQTSVITPK